MKNLSADVVIIGGGSTGAGVARDAAMRGFSTILVERADLGQGTTGRFHGLLHSGGRYVVSDPVSAQECATENAILRKIQSHAIEDTGGLFVVLDEDDPDYADKFLIAAQQTGVLAQEIKPRKALRREPRLNPQIQRAIEVADASVDGWQLVWGCARSAQAYGATVLTYHRVTKIQRSNDQVTAVLCYDDKHDDEVRIECSFVLNCAGPWAGQVSALAGLDPVQVVPGRGIMIAMNHRLVNTVINRCVYPTDGDILVPAHTVCIIGTTDERAEDPDRLDIPRSEVQQMLDSGEALVPGFRQARALHAWAGARPLMKDDRASNGQTRHMSRGMSIIDHQQEGLGGMLTIGGGKLTTYRLMAEHIVDAMCDQLGQQRECRTAQEAIPKSEDQKTYRVSHNLAAREKDRLDDQIVCECELVSKTELLEAAQTQPDAFLDDIRRQIRLGMGPCQGGYCSSRAAGMLCGAGLIKNDRASRLLHQFLANRWHGIAPILYGQQVNQTAHDHWIISGLLDVEHLPAVSKETLQ